MLETDNVVDWGKGNVSLEAGGDDVCPGEDIPLGGMEAGMGEDDRKR